MGSSDHRGCDRRVARPEADAAEACARAAADAARRCRRPRGSVRGSPLASVIGCLPPCVSSSSEPACSGRGPDSVPVPNRSPARRLQPLTVWCATSCAARPVGRLGEVRSAEALRRARPPRASRGVCSQHLERRCRSRRPRGWLRCRDRAAAPGRLRAARTARRNGASASIVTIQGDSVRGEVLRQERPERLVLPGLHVARAPVVEERDAEQVLLGLAIGDRLRRAHCRGR